MVKIYRFVSIRTVVKVLVKVAFNLLGLQQNYDISYAVFFVYFSYYFVY
jgi:hypothetical protein